MVDEAKGIEMPKLRSWKEFMFGGARYGMFDYKNIQKWNNRMISNLLYYQANYFLLMGIITAIGALIHPQAIIIGNILIYGELAAIISFHRDRDSKYGIALIVILLLILYCRHDVIYSLFFICLSLFVPMIHASLRLRNIQNRATNFICNQSNTPMGILLKTVLDLEMMSLDIDAKKANEFNKNIQSKIVNFLNGFEANISQIRKDKNE